MERLKLFLKGVCMGVADIIPGVSGGTMALILGIYAELVNTIKGLHLRWLPALWRWARSGFKTEERQELHEAWEAMNLSFLVVLGCGIVIAIGAGGMVLPGLLESHPEIMRALFFGLILASVGIPLRMVKTRGKRTAWVVTAAAVLGIGIGWTATAPDRMYEAGTTFVEVEAEDDESLQDILRRGPSAWPAEQVYWADENVELRESIDGERSVVELERPGEDAAIDKDAVSERSEAYEELEVAAGTPVQIPQPAPWYIFLAGLIAICAMILPGISGSYLLLIFGAYYFVLNALRAVIIGMTEFALPATATMYVALFCIGAAIGLLSFARLMSFLLRQFPAPTLGLLVGLMIGCLRGIWPFQSIVDGSVTNVMPTTFDTTVISVMVAVAVGAAVVTLLSRLGQRREVAEH